MVFPGGSDGKESTCNAGDLGSIPGLGNPMEKGTTTHSSILAWRMPQTQESGRLLSMGSQRVRHDWATFTHIQEINRKKYKQHERSHHHKGREQENKEQKRTTKTMNKMAINRYLSIIILKVNVLRQFTCKCTRSSNQKTKRAVC